jgi:formylglycine-generating enzyme required for sulfatase activity
MTAITTASARAEAAGTDARDAGEPDASSGAREDGGAPKGMVTIPAGMFMMGSPVERGLPEERPMHEVIVAAFDMDRTEIRTKDYLACVAAGACTRPHEDTPLCNTSRDASPNGSDGGASGDRGEHPINCIDARQAEAYCAFVGKRLPTEREWEYAARGGAEERRYSWGEDDPTTTNACYFHLGSCPVASFPPGAFGLYDMSGNVWEWTSSWFGPYPDEVTTGTHRVYRGGSWSRRFPKWLTTTMRNRYEPDKWTASLGARCARTRLPLVCPDESEARGDACVRNKGTPRCEATFAWNGEMCTFNGGPTPKRGFDPPPGASIEDEPVTKTRTPQSDADCAAHYRGTPAAYRFSGSSFHARNGPINGGGCVRRDMGQTWTSACCPQ